MLPTQGCKIFLKNPKLYLFEIDFVSPFHSHTLKTFRRWSYWNKMIVIKYTSVTISLISKITLRVVSHDVRSSLFIIRPLTDRILYYKIVFFSVVVVVVEISLFLSLETSTYTHAVVCAILYDCRNYYGYPPTFLNTFDMSLCIIA